MFGWGKELNKVPNQGGQRYWNILEILEKAMDTGKYTGKRPIFLDILEKNILEFGISKFDTGIYLKLIQAEHTSI